MTNQIKENQNLNCYKKTLGNHLYSYLFSPCCKLSQTFFNLTRSNAYKIRSLPFTIIPSQTANRISPNSSAMSYPPKKRNAN